MERQTIQGRIDALNRRVVGLDSAITKAEQASIDISSDSLEKYPILDQNNLRGIDVHNARVLKEAARTGLEEKTLPKLRDLREVAKSDLLDYLPKVTDIIQRVRILAAEGKASEEHLKEAEEYLHNFLTNLGIDEDSIDMGEIDVRRPDILVDLESDVLRITDDPGKREKAQRIIKRKEGTINYAVFMRLAEAQYSPVSSEEILRVAKEAGSENGVAGQIIGGVRQWIELSHRDPKLIILHRDGRETSYSLQARVVEKGGLSTEEAEEFFSKFVDEETIVQDDQSVADQGVEQETEQTSIKFKPYTRDWRGSERRGLGERINIAVTEVLTQEGVKHQMTMEEVTKCFPHIPGNVIRNSHQYGERFLKVDEAGRETISLLGVTSVFFSWYLAWGMRAREKDGAFRLIKKELEKRDAVAEEIKNVVEAMEIINRLRPEETIPPYLDNTQSRSYIDGLSNGNVDDAIKNGHISIEIEGEYKNKMRRADFGVLIWLKKFGADKTAQELELAVPRVREAIEKAF